MKKLIFGLVVILTLVVLIYSGYKILIKPAIRPVIRSDEDVKNAKVAVKCDYQNHSCDYFVPSVDAGNLKVIITVNAKPGKKIPVLLWETFNPNPNGRAYVKYTDENGIAFFEGIPSGVYFPNYNLIGFPKEYGNAYNSWAINRIEVTRDKTTETTLQLIQK